MGRQTIFGWWWVAGLVLTLSFVRSAGAIYLDEDQSVSLRSRIYNQTSLRMEGSYDDTTPRVVVGQMVQNRTFFNPELEAKLTPYTSWMKDTKFSLLAPDSLDFRLAAWAFYDGLYDYGPKQFKNQLSITQAHYVEATDINQALFGTADAANARDIFGNTQRVNELYLNYTKGPLFVRLGRQAISWGESDTVALLDQNNPFDLTLGAPGVFEDIDEARIPLWTVRTSYSLFESLGPLSSGFVEAYWVPGNLDTTTSTIPWPTWAPYVAPGPDPQSNPLLRLMNNPQFVLINHVPSPQFGNSRYGFRVQAVVARDYTVSAWYYTAFNQTPVPRIDSTSLPPPTSSACQIDPATGRCRPLLGVEILQTKLVPIVGVSNTFFFQPLNGIIRMEAEYFNHEPGFIPQKNLLVPQLDSNPTLVTLACKGPQGQPVQCGSRFAPPQFVKVGQVPYADFLRWELGYDRFFFFRPLNPSNSFTWVSAVVGQWNMSETSQKDFYYYGQQKPGTFSNPQPQPSDFVQLQKVEMFAQTHLQTDYLHGRLSPQFTFIQNLRGTFAALPQLTFRYTDWLLFDLYYVNIGGMFTQLGFFRDRDQLAIRATYQLN